MPAGKRPRVPDGRRPVARGRCDELVGALELRVDTRCRAGQAARSLRAAWPLRTARSLWATHSLRTLRTAEPPMAAPAYAVVSYHAPATPAVPPEAASETEGRSCGTGGEVEGRSREAAVDGRMRKDGFHFSGSGAGRRLKHRRHENAERRRRDGPGSCAPAGGNARKPSVTTGSHLAPCRFVIPGNRLTSPRWAASRGYPTWNAMTLQFDERRLKGFLDNGKMSAAPPEESRFMCRDALSSLIIKIAVNGRGSGGFMCFVERLGFVW